MMAKQGKLYTKEDAQKILVIRVMSLSMKKIFGHFPLV